MPNKTKYIVPIFIELKDTSTELKGYVESKECKQATLLKNKGTIIVSEDKETDKTTYNMIVRKEFSINKNLLTYSVESTEITEEVYTYTTEVVGKYIKFMEYSYQLESSKLKDGSTDTSLPKQEILVRRYMDKEGNLTNYLMVLIDVTDNINYVDENKQEVEDIKFEINLKKILGVELGNAIVFNKNTTEAERNYIDSVMISKLQVVMDN